jgi:hypothetical protein
MALAIVLLHTLRIFVMLPIAMLVYVGVSVLIGVIPREDYQAIYRAIRQKAQPTPRPSTGGVPETPLPSYDPDALLEDGLATTVKLPAVRPHPMQRTPLAQQGQIVSMSGENSSSNGGVVG